MFQVPGFTGPHYNQPQRLSTTVLEYILRIVVILCGDFVGAVSINNFLIPARTLAGGLTGIAQLIHHLWLFPIGTVYFILNIPLIIIGYKYLGKRFIVLTGIGIVGFSALANLVKLPIHPGTDPLLLCLYGGVLGGISSGLVIRAGGSTGGTDILSLVFNRITGKSVGGISFAMNVIVVLLSLTIYGLQAGMYTLVAMFAATRLINALMNYQNRKTALIVSLHTSAIASQIHQRLGRGSTLIAASGTYTHAAVGVLICALTQLEVSDLKLLVRETDPNAFVTILDTTEVVGRFRRIPVS